MSGTTRTIGLGSGPINFSLEGEFLSVRVVVGGRTAEIVLTAEGKAAVDAVSRARLSRLSGWEHLTVPEVPGVSTGTVIRAGGAMIVNQSASVVAGNMTGVTITGGEMMVNGVRITPELLREAAKQQGVEINGGIEALVRLPEDSSLKVRTENSDIHVEGERLKTVDVDATNGSLSTRTQVETLLYEGRNGSLTAANRVHSLKASCRNGNIYVADLHGSGTADNRNGNISIVVTAPGEVRADNRNGNIHISDPLGLARDRRLRVRTSNRNGTVTAPR